MRQATLDRQVAEAGALLVVGQVMDGTPVRQNSSSSKRQRKKMEVSGEREALMGSRESRRAAP